VATSSCHGHVDELATEPFLLLHHEHGTGYRRSWNCCDRRTCFVVIWKHFCFILSTGTRIQIDSVMRPRPSSRRRNTSASVTVTVTKQPIIATNLQQKFTDDVGSGVCSIGSRLTVENHLHSGGGSFKLLYEITSPSNHKWNLQQCYITSVLEISFCTVPLQQFLWQRHLNHIHSLIHSLIHSFIVGQCFHCNFW